ETQPQPRVKAIANPSEICAATRYMRPTKPQAPSRTPPRPLFEMRHEQWPPAANRPAEILQVPSLWRSDHETRAGSTHKESRSHKACLRNLHQGFLQCAKARPARS